MVNVRSMHEMDCSYLPSESFYILVQTEAEKDSLLRNFQKLLERKARRPKGPHFNHEGQMFALSLDDSGSI